VEADTLYRIVRAVAIFGIKIFFNRIINKNSENIPDDGPIIFVANHPNTMMDAALIAYTCRRDTYFLAKSTLFKKPLYGKILKKLHNIPVYRKQDVGSDTGKNIDTFEKCFSHIESGDSIVIFPEGVSTGERVINPIKTGSARIALEVEERNNFQLGLKIIPVGLSYSNLVRFGSDAYVRYGYPINIADHKEAYGNDQFATVYEITNQVETALTKLTTTLKDLEIEKIVQALETIYKDELIVDLGYSKKDEHDEFSVTKGLINAVEWYYENEPVRFNLFKEKLSNYLSSLDHLKIIDEFIAPGKGEFTFLRRAGALTLIILGFPLFCIGLVNNYLPYQFPRWFAGKYVPDISFRAPIKMITGGGVFLLYYGLVLTGMHLFFQNVWVTGIYAIFLVPSGNFILKYLKYIGKYRQHFRFIKLFYKQRQRIYRLINQREELIEFINKAKNDYMSAMGLKQTP